MSNALAGIWILMICAGSLRMLTVFFQPGIAPPEVPAFLAAVLVVFSFFTDLSLVLIMLAAWRRRGLGALLLLLGPLMLLIGIAAAWQGADVGIAMRLLRGVATSVVATGTAVALLRPVTRAWPRPGSTESDPR